MDIEKIQAFFFNAMLHGWASGAEAGEVIDMPGYEAIPFREGDLSLLDCYCMNPSSGKSAGTTTIWYQDTPVWFMSYGGHYEEAAILCLKHALLKAYQEGLFLGGRGVNSFQEGSLSYNNEAHAPNFVTFSGREAVFDVQANISLGYHQYWGMSLI